jgi:hypothetical protein
MELGSGGVAAHVFAPRHFAGILAEMRPGDMVMLTNLRASQPGDIAFGLVRAGARHLAGISLGHDVDARSVMTLGGIISRRCSLPCRDGGPAWPKTDAERMNLV